jgi:hypothetical protein
MNYKTIKIMMKKQYCKNKQTQINKINDITTNININYFDLNKDKQSNLSKPLSKDQKREYYSIFFLLNNNLIYQKKEFHFTSINLKIKKQFNHNSLLYIYFSNIISYLTALKKEFFLSNHFLFKIYTEYNKIIKF